MEDHGRPLGTFRVRATRAQRLGVCLSLLALCLAAPAAWAEDPQSRMDRARDALWQWHLDEAEAALKARVSKPYAVTRTVLRARLDLARSRYADVVTKLGPLVARTPDAFEARVVLGEALIALGKKAEATAIMDLLADGFHDGTLQAPADLVWLGQAMGLMDYPQDAKETLEDAIRAEPPPPFARVLLGDLYLSKANFRDADALYKEALQARPDDVRATLGRARVDIDSDHDYPKALERIDGVLAASPQCLPAHNLRARIAIENERTTTAIGRLQDHSLRLAPGDPEALALLGAATYLADDAKGFSRAETRALASNPRFARFYSTVSEHAARMHRYEEAVALDRKALALDGEHWPSYVNLGMGMSRLGDDGKARQHLERAHEGDPYNVQTFNLLDRFYDRAIKEFGWVDVGAMRLRLHKSERDVLSHYVPPLLSEAYRHLVRKYGVKPKPPLHIEIFPSPELFAVRSIGLPRLGAHGICFGHVITSRSPRTGDFNWAEVLWHELSHVFHIQLSRSRVPRWFTEGLAVYESADGRPEWRREMDPALLTYKEAGKLRGVAEFNLSFTRARSMGDILVAYYHASRLAEFIHETWGFPAMRKMLVLWGRRKKTPEVFATALQVADLAAFDARFQTWLDGKLAHLKTGARLSPDEGAADVVERTERAAKRPRDAAAQAAAAEAWLGKGDLAKALSYAERALSRDGDHTLGRLVRGFVRLRAGEHAGARTDFEAVLGQGKDGLALRRALARIAIAEKKIEEGIGHMERAHAIDPRAVDVMGALITILDAEGRGEDAYRWRAKAVRLDQSSIALVDSLLEGGARYGASRAEILHWGEMGHHIAPFSVDHHLVFARELKRLGLHNRATQEVRMALVIDPDHAQARAMMVTLTD